MKKVSIFFLIVLAAMAVMYFVLYKVAVWQESGSGGKTETATAHGAPTFDQYPATSGFTGVPAPVDFGAHPEAETFTTRITEGATQGPNFAGHYTVVTWGCGTSCQESAIIDAKTGAIAEYGIPSTYELAYTVGSNLLIVNPKENIPLGALQTANDYPDEHYPMGSLPLVSDYYVMREGRLTFVGEWSALTGQKRTCTPQPSPARNPITEEEKTFDMPCAIPYGWDALETGEGTQ